MLKLPATASERLRQLAMALGTSLDDLLEAAGYRDPVRADGDLPDLAVYLRHKYGLDDPRLIEAVAVILNSLSGAARPHE